MSRWRHSLTNSTPTPYFRGVCGDVAALKNNPDYDGEEI